MEVFMSSRTTTHSGRHYHNHDDEITWQLVLNPLGMISSVIIKEVDQVHGAVLVPYRLLSGKNCGQLFY